MGSWIAVSFDILPGQEEVALAILAEFPFTAFEENPGGWDAYLPDRDWTPELIEQLSHWQGRLWTDWTLSFPPDENWNELWESRFEPVDLSPFCVIRATFHPARPDALYDLVIQPEMAFGTGHHATTRMMVKAVRDLDLAGKEVLDFGAGTAILAILAVRAGAHHADAVEIEAPACRSARENVLRNGVEGRVDVLEGDLSTAHGRKYDLILANINRNVLLLSLPALDEHLIPGGRIGLSGYLPQDVPLMDAAAADLGWVAQSSATDENWMSQWWEKPQRS